MPSPPASDHTPIGVESHRPAVPTRVFRRTGSVLTPFDTSDLDNENWREQE